MSAEERCADFRAHIRIDFERTLTSVVPPGSRPHVLDQLVEDAMFYVEHLVLEAGESNDTRAGGEAGSITA